MGKTKDDYTYPFHFRVRNRDDIDNSQEESQSELVPSERLGTIEISFMRRYGLEQVLRKPGARKKAGNSAAPPQTAALHLGSVKKGVLLSHTT